jgi:hypothetical protein
VYLRGYLVQVSDLADKLVQEVKGSTLLTAIYIGQELRGVLSDARFLRVFEHGTLADSDVISELFYMTSRRKSGIVCTPIGGVTLECRLLAVLPPDTKSTSLRAFGLLCSFCC